MGSVSHIANADWLKEAWTLAGSSVTRLFEAWNNDDDTKYASCPSYRGRAACTFPTDITSVPEGAVITSVTVYVRARKMDSLARYLICNLLSRDLTSIFTHRSIPLTTTITTHEIGTYFKDPRGLPWDLHRINQCVAQILCNTSLADAIRCYKVYIVINYRVRPTVQVTAPTGTVKTPSPTLTWVYTQTDGDPQAKADYKIFTAAEKIKPTFNPDSTTPVYSNTVVGDITSLTLPYALDPGDYYLYVRAHSSATAKSVWTGGAFTVQGPSPGIPEITAVGDSATSSVTLTLQDTSNLLSVQQADAETSTDRDEYIGTNCTVAQNTSTFYNVGSAAYSLTASSAATMSMLSTRIACGISMPITARVQTRTAVTGRTVNLRVKFWDNTHTELTGDVLTASGTDTSSTWTEVTLTGTTPATAAYMKLEYEVVSPASSEVHYVDALGIMYGTGSAWSHGGHLSRNILSADYSCHPGYASWTLPSGGTTQSNVTAGITQPGAHGPSALRLTGATIAPSISFVATGTVYTTTTAGTTFTLNKPASVTTGDLMIAFVSTNEDSEVTVPAGWTYVAKSSVNDGSSDTCMFVLMRTATASEPSSWTDGLVNVSASRRTAVVVAYRGADTAANQFIAHNVSTSSTSTPTYLKTATLTNTNANAWRIAAFAVNDNNTGGTMIANRVDPATGISYVGAASAWSSTSSGTSFSINKPSGIATGDLMVASLAVTGTVTVTPPTGWTAVRTTTQAGSPATTLCIMTRTATASEPSSWTGSVSSSTRPRISQCAAYRQADTAALQFIAENSSTSGSGNSTITTATVNNTSSSSWRMCVFAANDNDGRSWTSTETSERSDNEASYDSGGWFSSSVEGMTLSMHDSNGTVGTGNHSKTGTLSSSWDSAVSWIGIIKVLGTPPTPVANETERTDSTTGASTPWLTQAVYDSNATVPVGATDVTGTFTPGGGSGVESMVSWIGLIKPPDPVTTGTVQATMTDYTYITDVSSDVLDLCDNKITFGASFIGSTAGTPYLKMYFYRGNELISSEIAEGNSFGTTEWIPSTATWTLPTGTTRVKGEVQITNRNSGDTVDIDQLMICFGESTVWRAGTGRTTHPIWNVPIIEYADDDGNGYTDWQPLLGLELNRPTYDDLFGQLEYVDHTLVPLTTRKYRAQTFSYGLNGDSFVSAFSPDSNEISVTGTNWWIKNIANPDDNMIINVKAEDVNVTTTNTSTVFQPLGEDYPIVVTEGYKADMFSLTLRCSREEWVELNRVLRLGITLFLQSDTDKAWWVRSTDNIDATTIVAADRQSNPTRWVNVQFVEVKAEV